MLLAGVLSFRYPRYPYPFPLHEPTTPVATASAATERVTEQQTQTSHETTSKCVRAPSAYRVVVHVLRMYGAECLQLTSGLFRVPHRNGGRLRGFTSGSAACLFGSAYHITSLGW